VIARELVDDGWTRLEAAGIPEARAKVEWFAASVLDISREQLDVAPVSEAQQETFSAGLARLEQHEPLQYVIGHAPFLDLNIFTDRRALIPRPETEELAMRVVSCAPLWSRQPARVADVGTGTGCLAILFAVRFPSAQIHAIDPSPDALALARANADYAGVADRIQFRQEDLLSNFAPDSLDAVVSNPPYIASSVISTLERNVRDYEPMSALDGGPDGLALIKKLIPQAFTALTDGGRVWLEIGDEQGESVYQLLKANSFREIVIDRDMYGQVRFAGAVK